MYGRDAHWGNWGDRKDGTFRVRSITVLLEVREGGKKSWNRWSCVPGARVQRKGKEACGRERRIVELEGVRWIWMEKGIGKGE